MSFEEKAWSLGAAMGTGSMSDLQQWDPWEELERLQQMVRRLFEEFFSRIEPLAGGRQISFSPPTDVYESPSDIVLRVALPGVLEEDIDISLEGDVLTIRGEREPPLDALPDGYSNREWTYGYFERKVRLPADRISPNINAAFSDGVLEIRIAKLSTASHE